MKRLSITSLLAAVCLAAPMEEYTFLIRDAEPQLGAALGMNVGSNVVPSMTAALRIGATTTRTTTTTRPAATTPGSSDGSSTYITPILQQHNNHRQNHSANNLVWDNGLASTAQTIASSCYYAHNVTVNGGGYGQNIGAGYYPSQVPAMLTNGMYNGEVGFYPAYGVEPDMSNFARWGHFSQIVWKSTTNVGCYTQYCPNGLGNVGTANIRPYFTVCNYSPPGKSYVELQR